MNPATVIRRAPKGTAATITVGSQAVPAVVGSISAEEVANKYGTVSGYQQSAYVDKGRLSAEPVAKDTVTLANTTYRILGVFRYAGTTMRRLDLGEQYATG